MDIVVDAKHILRKWPHIEKYQNTTLRYTPDSSFPKAMEKYMGKPKIIRLFVTLDEVWDYRTDTYDWNYLIGVNKFEGDSEHYHYDYDWPYTEPSPFGVRIEEYITSHASHAEKVMLNIRRYEREVVDGYIPITKYEEVLEKVIEHFKEMCPNICYIEIGNEVDDPKFGGLTMEEFYPLYQCGYKSVSRLNSIHKYENPLLVGAYGLTFGISNWKNWDKFLKFLACDNERVIDFYSMHEYHTNPSRILEFYIRHESRIRELGLPDLPLFMTEYGLRVGVGDAGRPHNLQNASGEIAGFILGSYCENLRIFPWCTFHNPNQQLGRTMFVINKEGKYVPTPSGHVMKMFNMLGDEELLIDGYTWNSSVATINGDKQICILLSNPKIEKEEIYLSIKNLDSGTYQLRQYLVDERTNNCINNHSHDCLSITKEDKFIVESEINMNLTMDAYAFCLFVMDKID